MNQKWFLSVLVLALVVVSLGSFTTPAEAKPLAWHVAGYIPNLACVLGSEDSTYKVEIKQSQEFPGAYIKSNVGDPLSGTLRKGQTASGKFLAAWLNSADTQWVSWAVTAKADCRPAPTATLPPAPTATSTVQPSETPEPTPEETPEKTPEPSPTSNPSPTATEQKTNYQITGSLNFCISGLPEGWFSVSVSPLAGGTLDAIRVNGVSLTPGSYTTLPFAEWKGKSIEVWGHFVSGNEDSSAVRVPETEPTCFAATPVAPVALAAPAATGGAIPWGKIATTMVAIGICLAVIRRQMPHKMGRK